MARQSKRKSNGFKTLNIDGINYKTHLTEKFIKRKVYAAHNPKLIIAIIPGKIRKVMVKPGDKVKEGDEMLILEAMKMYNKIMAPFDGTIKEVHVKQGVIVPKDELLIVFK